MRKSAIKQGVYRYTPQKVFRAEYPIARLAHEIALGKGQRSGEGGRRHGGNAEETGRRAEGGGKEGLGGEVSVIYAFRLAKNQGCADFYHIYCLLHYQVM